MRPDGLFIGCLLGGRTLQELREALLAAEAETTGGVSPRVAPFADLRDMGSLLQRAGFALPVVDSELVTVRYRDMFGLLRDLRAMGWANALTRPAQGAACAATRCCARPRSMPSASPMPTGGCARPSRWSGSRAGRRMRASRSRSGRARPRRGWPMRSACPRSGPARRRGSDGEQRPMSERPGGSVATTSGCFAPFRRAGSTMTSSVTSTMSSIIPGSTRR